jgi:hypothetical protein
MFYMSPLPSDLTVGIDEPAGSHRQIELRRNRRWRRDEDSAFKALRTPNVLSMTWGVNTLTDLLLWCERLNLRDAHLTGLKADLIRGNVIVRFTAHCCEECIEV